MKAMVLAAGRGTRLKPHTDTIPKPMMPVAGRPLLEHIFEQIRAAGIADIVVNLHHRPEVIQNYFRDGGRHNIRLTYSFEPDLLGTAGAVLKLAAEFTETFLVYYGDNYVELDLPDLIRSHRQSKSDATIAVFSCEEPHRSGIVQADDSGRIFNFVEKPDPEIDVGRLANAGVYVLEPKVIPVIPAGRAVDFGRDIFPELIRNHFFLQAYPLRAAVYGIDTPELHARLVRHLAERTN